MIIYSAYFIALSVFFMSTTWIFDPLFQLTGVPTGYRSIALQVLMVGLSLAILARSRMPKVAAELGGAVAAWLPWLVYAALRCDFSDPNAVLYFAKLVLIQFVSVLTLIVMYRSDPRVFTRYFLIWGVLLGVVVVAKAIIDPEVFIYATVIERLTIEDANPIWLSRTFAFAAICVMFLPFRNVPLKIVGVLAFAAAMIPTGSRAPLAALVAVVALFFISKYAAARTFLLASVGVAVALVATTLVPGVSDGVAEFFSRGRNLGVLEESGRSMLFAQAAKEFMSAPLIGVGLNQFGVGNTTTTWLNAVRSYPHNMILEVLSGAGAVGFVLFAITFRFGRWLLSPSGPYYFLFIFSLLAAMTSGNLHANNGVIIFAVLARLAYLHAKEAPKAKVASKQKTDAPAGDAAPAAEEPKVSRPRQ